MQRSFEVRMGRDAEKRLRHAAEKRNTDVEELLHQLITEFLHSEEHSVSPRHSHVEIRPSSSRHSDDGGGKEPLYNDLSEEEFCDLLSPEMQKFYDELGQPAPALELDDDTRAWIDIAAAGDVAGTEAVVTRNEEDFQRTPLQVYHPNDLLMRLSN